MRTRSRLYIFDLDGTLVDSLRDIAESVNDCLELLGLPSRPVNDYRYLVGEGVPKLCQRLLGSEYPHLIGRLAELGRARYRTRPMQHTAPYGGILDLVGRLHAAGSRLAVLSNKPDELTRLIVQAIWPNGTFDRIYGYVDEQHRKPDPHYVHRICDELAVPPGSTCLIGDTPTDIETAARAGTAAIGVTWGFRSREDLVAAGATHIVNDPGEIQ